VGTVLDAYPLIALATSESAATEVELLLRQGGAAITSVNLGEVLDVLGRRHGATEERLRADLALLVGSHLRVVPVTEEHGWRAGGLRSRYYQRSRDDLSLADCFLLAAAGPDDRIATADPAVARAARGEGIEVVALPDSTGRRP
jgi:PIN domain nuclease of toxin-antitoxin system